jgi:hypothetical protein
MSTVVASLKEPNAHRQFEVNCSSEQVSESRDGVSLRDMQKTSGPKFQLGVIFRTLVVSDCLGLLSANCLPDQLPEPAVFPFIPSVHPTRCGVAILSITNRQSGNPRMRLTFPRLAPCRSPRCRANPEPSCPPPASDHHLFAFCLFDNGMSICGNVAAIRILVCSTNLALDPKTGESQVGTLCRRSRRPGFRIGTWIRSRLSARPPAASRDSISKKCRPKILCLRRATFPLSVR